MKNKFISTTQFFSNLPKVTYLFKNLWKECTTALLHAPREVDKSAKAFEIASALAFGGRPVIYVNTERRVDDLAGRYPGVDNLYIFTPEYESPDDTTDYADLVIAGIEEAVATTDVRTFVIDSVTRIAALSFGRNASAAYVMKRLVALQVRCGLSLLVISHDSTRSADRALLNLSDSEITLTAEPVPTAEFDNSDNSDSSDSSDSSDKSNQSDAPSRRNLSRRDRRLLRRQQQSRKPDKIK